MDNIKMLLQNLEEIMKKKGIITTSGTIRDINTILLHKRCIFMSMNQYDKKVHINNKIYTNVSIVKDVKSHIINHIKSVANDAPYKKVPRPIYVMVSKKLEYDENDSIILGNCNNEIGAYSSGKITYSEIKNLDKKKNPNYKGYNSQCFYDKDEKYSKEQMDKYKFINDNINQDIDKLKSSSLASYKFKGNYEVIISIPNLNKDKKYFTSYYDFYQQNQFMNLLVNKHNFLNLIKIDKEIPEIFKIIIKNPQQYKKFVDFYNSKNAKNYPLINDLTSVCYDLGCSSDNGEDLQQMIPKLSDNYDDLVNNTKAKAPYFPTKCLRTSYYTNHMIDYTKEEYNTELKKKILEDIDNYKNNLEKLKKGENPDKQSGDNIVDVLKNSAFQFRNEKYINKDREDYSEDYNRKILAELAFRNNTVPGVQEIIFSVFQVNDTFAEINNVTSIMPWGNFLLKKDSVLIENDEFDIEKYSIKSFNKQFEIKLFNNKLCLLKNGTLVRVLIDINFGAYKNKTIILENGNLTIYGFDASGKKDNRYNKSVISNKNYKSPISLIVENNGIINIYDNGFNIVGSL
jgi:hypothetical protein